MRHSIIQALFFLSLLCGTASAHNAPERSAPAHFVYEEIGLYDSTGGETKTAFMTRVAQGLLEFTTRTGFEGCGVLQVNAEGGFRLRLTTTGSQIACVRVAFREEGYQPVNEFIHSHPPVYRITLNEVDARLGRRMVGEQIGVFPPEYSEGDKRNGGGWLVIPKWRFDPPQLRYLGENSNGNGARIAKLMAIPAVVPSVPGENAYVMSANGNESTTMHVSIKP